MSRRLIHVALFFTVLSCVGTPLPDPPMLHRDALSGLNAGASGTLVIGDAGAVSSAGSEIVVWNLSTNDPPVRIVSIDDGSFKALVPGSIYDELRLQAINQGGRSSPIDVVWEIREVTPSCIVLEDWELCPYQPDQESCLGLSSYCVWSEGTCDGEGPATTPACGSAPNESTCVSIPDCVWGDTDESTGVEPLRPLEDCLHLDPAFELSIGSGTAGSLSITNDCTSDVELTFSLRDGTTGFSLAPDPGTLIVGSGTSDTVSVSFTSTEIGPADDILYVEILSPESGRRSITVFGF